MRLANCYLSGVKAESFSFIGTLLQHQLPIHSDYGSLSIDSEEQCGSSQSQDPYAQHTAADILRRDSALSHQLSGNFPFVASQQSNSGRFVAGRAVGDSPRYVYLILLAARSHADPLLQPCKSVGFWIRHDLHRGNMFQYYENKAQQRTTSRSPLLHHIVVLWTRKWSADVLILILHSYEKTYEGADKISLISYHTTGNFPESTSGSISTSPSSAASSSLAYTAYSPHYTSAGHFPGAVQLSQTFVPSTYSTPARSSSLFVSPDSVSQ